MNTRLKFSFALGIFPVVGSAVLAQQAPNIILVLTDDMGIGDVSCYGSALSISTPNIDKMAREGIRFTQYYCASPISSPSRAGFLTGQYPARWNITSYLQTKEGNRNAEMADYLDPQAPSLARILKSAGYKTAHFGKWHLGGGRDVTDAPSITEYGYDEYSSTYESPDPDPMLTATNWIWSKYDPVKRWNRTNYFVTKTMTFLKKNKNKPCFVTLWPDDVHTPWIGNEAQMDLYPDSASSMTNFITVLAEYDRQIGLLLQQLKNEGLDDNTIVIFTSDNGPDPSFSHIRTNGLRGCKSSLFEGGIRMPFIIWNGGNLIPKGKIDSTTVLTTVDMLPSLCQLVNASVPPSVNSDGEDMSAALLGTPQIRSKEIYWEYGRSSNPAFPYPKGMDKSPNVCVRQGDWKLLINADGSNLMLFNLKTDPYETTNVSSVYPEIADSLRTKALNWRRLFGSTVGVDTTLYVPQFGYKLENRWIYSQAFGNYNLIGATGTVRGMAVNNGKMLFSSRNSGNQILRVDGSTGVHLTPVTLASSIFTYDNNGTATAVTYPCNDIQVDDAGGVLISNMITAATDRWQVWKINMTDGTGRLIIDQSNLSQFNTNIRFDGFGVWGNVNKNAIIMAINTHGSNKTPEVYKWTITDGVVGAPVKISLNTTLSGTPLTGKTSVGGNARLLPMQNYFYLDAQATGMHLMRLDYTGKPIDGFYKNTKALTDSTTVPGSKFTMHPGNNGVREFNIGNNYFLILASTPHDGTPPGTFRIFKFADANKSFSGLNCMWTFPVTGMGNTECTYRSAIPCVEVVDDTAKIYLYAGENGYAMYNMSPALINDLNKINVTVSHVGIALRNGKICISEVVKSAEIFSVSGQKIISERNVSEIFAPTQKGIYIVSVMDNSGVKKVVKIAVQ